MPTALAMCLLLYTLPKLTVQLYIHTQLKKKQTEHTHPYSLCTIIISHFPPVVGHLHSTSNLPSMLLVYQNYENCVSFQEYQPAKA